MMELLDAVGMKGSLCCRIVATGLCFSCNRIRTMLQVHFLMLQVWTSRCRFELHCCRFVFVVIPRWLERIPRCCRIVVVYATGSSSSVFAGSGCCCRFAELPQNWFWWSRDPDFVIIPRITLLCHGIILLCHGIILLYCMINLLRFEEAIKGVQ